MKYRITYAAGCHTATESDFATLLATVREEFPEAVAFDSAGNPIDTNADATPGVDVLIWEDVASSYNDDGQRAIARVAVEGGKA